MAVADKSELKERERANWSSAAEGWRRRDDLLRTGAQPVTRRMLELAGIQPSSRLLDIASGTGEPAISAAQLVTESGQVVGTDLVDEMLAVAREKSEKLKLGNIEFHTMDAENLNFQPGSFDAVTIRWGLMFMPSPETCLTSAHKVLRQGGRISLACWAAPEVNPFVSVLMKVLGNYMELPVPPPGTPGIFAFADPDRLKGVMSASGFKNIEIEEMEINVLEVEDGSAYWAAISDLAAPIMALVRGLDESTRAEYIKEVILVADSMKKGDVLQMKGVTWLAAAEK